MTNNPRNKNFQWIGAEIGLDKQKTPEKRIVGLRLSGEKSEHLSFRRIVVLTY